MVERCQHLRFPLEAGEAFGVVDKGVRENLQGDIAVELGVTSPVHLAHAAHPDLGGDLIQPEARADFHCHENEEL